MKVANGFMNFTICRTVRKYQRQIVLPVETRNTLVPLAQKDVLSRLTRHPFVPVTE